MREKRKVRIRLPCLSACLLMVAALAVPVRPAVAQDPDTDPSTAADTFEIDEIVVTATRVPSHRRSLPTPVTVLTGAELRANGVRTLAQALRQVPGAVVARAGPEGAQTSLFLRGAESDYVKVLIDGVPVNDPGGAVDFAALSTHQIERIEVVRGPVSVLYGSDAVAGVVQVFTRRGEAAPRWSARVTGGRGERRHVDGGYGVAEGEVTVSGRADDIAYAVGAGHSRNGGLYPFNSQHALTDGAIRLGWSRSAFNLAVSTRLNDSESHFPTDGAGALVDRNARIERRLWTTSVDGGWRLSDRVEADLRLGLTTRRQGTIDPVDGPADTTGTFASENVWDMARRSVDARVNVTFSRAVLTGGFALERAEADTRYRSESEFGPYAAAAEYDRTNRGYYAQVLGEPIAGLDLTLGGRIDDNETYGTFATYRAGASVEPVHGTRLRAAIGLGFREPSFAENFGSGFGDTGNARLDPERSRSIEAGVQQRITPDARVQVTAFDQRFRDLIQYTFSPPSEGDPNYFNVGAARSRGVELEVEVEAGRAGLDASYTWLETDVLDPGLATDASFVEGQPLLRRPRHSGSLMGRYALPDGVISITATAVGEREDLDFSAGFPAPRVTLPAYALLDVAAEHRLPLGVKPRASVLARVENLFDARFQAIRGFPAPGRVVRLGIRLGNGPG